MQETELLLLFTEALDQARLKYFVTGSMACILYGEPRLTMDVDLVLALAQNDADKIESAFPESQFYCPPIEILKIEASRSLRGHFNIIHHESGFKADCYIAGTDPLHRWAFTKIHEVSLNQKKVFFAPPEYVIIRKLEYYREGNSEKHVRDIQAMLQHSKSEIDMHELERIVHDQGLESVWEKIQTLCAKKIF